MVVSRIIRSYQHVFSNCGVRHYPRFAIIPLSPNIFLNTEKLLDNSTEDGPHHFPETSSYRFVAEKLYHRTRHLPHSIYIQIVKLKKINNVRMSFF